VSIILYDFMVPATEQAKQHSKSLLLRQEAAYSWFRHLCKTLQTGAQTCNNSMAHTN